MDMPGDKTVDWFIDRYLVRSGLSWVRFDSDAFPENYKIDGGLDRVLIHDQYGEMVLNSTEISSVWYRRNLPSVFQATVLAADVLGYARSEAQAALRALNTALSGAYFVNKPDANHTASDKLGQLLDASARGLRVPKTLITNDKSLALEFVDTCGGEVIVKPLRKGTIAPGKVFYSTLIRAVDLETRGNAIAIAPVIFQEPIKKAYELRIAVVDEECFGVKIFSQEHGITSIDWRRSPLLIRHEIAELPQHIASACVEMVKASGLVYSAFDFIVSPEGEHVFLEHNPGGQFAWLEELTGIPIGRGLLGALSKS